MKVIELTRGQVTIVDDQDFAELAQWRWQCSKGGYATRSQRIHECGERHKRKCIYMHVVVFGSPIPKGFQVDHRNGNLLDNRRRNLRLATCQQNQQNAKVRIDNVVGLKGIMLEKESGLYRARIRDCSGNRIYLGRYATAEEAKMAYDQAAIFFHGDFHRLN